ncbi:hypothetical protein CROQUDRAFT_51507, partial [Cronartium quercuum f. sp. fusiforme G11]
HLLIDTAVSFGRVAGCGTFGRVADAWRETILYEFNLVNIFRWVDEAFFLKEFEEVIEMQTTVEKSQELGVKTNINKLAALEPE